MKDDETGQKYTKRCVLCGAPAVTWTGHVLDKDEQKRIAGWCNKHDRIPLGFFGHYKKWMK